MLKIFFSALKNFENFISSHTKFQLTSGFVSSQYVIVIHHSLNHLIAYNYSMNCLQLNQVETTLNTIWILSVNFFWTDIMNLTNFPNTELCLAQNPIKYHGKAYATSIHHAVEAAAAFKPKLTTKYNHPWATAKGGITDIIWHRFGGKVSVNKISITTRRVKRAGILVKFYTGRVSTYNQKCVCSHETHLQREHIFKNFN